MGAAASSVECKDRFDVAATRNLIESQSYSFGVRWLDGFDQAKGSDGTIDASQLLRLAEKYAARHSSSAVQEHVGSLVKEDLLKVIPRDASSEEDEADDIGDFTINTLQWNIAGVNKNPFEWKSSTYASELIAEFFAEIESEFARQVRSSSHTVGELLGRVPSGYSEAQAKRRGGHVPCPILEAAEAAEGDTLEMIKCIKDWQLSDLFLFEEKTKAQIFSKPDMWLKDRHHTLCALSAEGCFDFFLCPDGEEHYWRLYMDDVKKLVSELVKEGSGMSYCLKKLKGKDIPGCACTEVISRTAEGWVLFMNIFDGFVRKVAIDVMHNMLQKHSEGGRARMIGPFQKQALSDMRSFISSMAVTEEAKADSVTSTLIAYHQRVGLDVLCLDELNDAFATAMREQVCKEEEFYLIDAADTDSFLVQLEPQFVKIYLRKAKFTTEPRCVSMELFEKFTNLGGRQQLGQKIAAAHTSVVHDGVKTEFLILALHTQAKDRAVMLQAVRELLDEERYQDAKLILAMDANVESGQQVNFIKEAESKHGLHNCFTASHWTPRTLAASWTTKKERTCMQTQLHKTGLLDIALKDYIFFNDAKTKCDTHILNNFDGKAGELAYTNVFCPHPSFSSDHTIVMATSIYRSKYIRSPTSGMRRLRSPIPASRTASPVPSQRTLAQSESAPVFSSQFHPSRV